MKRKSGVIILILVVVVAVIIGMWMKNGSRANVIYLGAILSLSGDKAPYGVAAKNGIELAVEEVNSKGGIHGRTLSVVFEDGKGSPRDSVSAFEKLINYNKVPAVIGPLTSSEVLSIAPIAEREHVVVLSPGASSPAITTAGDYIFRNVPSDVFEGRAMAEAARQTLHLSRVAVIYVNNEYGIGVLKVFQERFSHLGGTVSTAQAYPDGSRDFRTQIVSVKSHNPEAVYLVGYKELGLIVKQAKELGLNTRFLSTALFEDPDVIKSAGSGGEGVIFTSITFDSKSSNPRARAFVQAYSQKYGKEPDSFAAISYDATHIMANAIKVGGPTAPQIKEALYSTQNFPGLLGNTSFDTNGDVILPVVLKTVKEGKFVAFP